ILLQFVADDPAADRSDDHRGGFAPALPGDAAETAADQRARDGARARLILLPIDLLYGFDGADARNRLVVDLIGRLLRAARDGDDGDDQQCEMAGAFDELHGVAPKRDIHSWKAHSGIAFRRYIAASSPDGRPSLPSHWR